MRETLPLISNVAKDELKFSEEKTEEFMKKWDKNSDGKLDTPLINGFDIVAFPKTGMNSQLNASVLTQMS